MGPSLGEGRRMVIRRPSIIGAVGGWQTAGTRDYVKVQGTGHGFKGRR